MMRRSGADGNRKGSLSRATGARRDAADVSDSRGWRWRSNTNSSHRTGPCGTERLAPGDRNKDGQRVPANGLEALDRTHACRTLAVLVATRTIIVSHRLHTGAVFHCRRTGGDSACPRRRHSEADNYEHGEDEAQQAHECFGLQATTVAGQSLKYNARVRGPEFTEIEFTYFSPRALALRC